MVVRDRATVVVVASANTIPVHLHVHTNNGAGIILTGMQVVRHDGGVKRWRRRWRRSERTRYGRAPWLEPDKYTIIYMLDLYLASYTFRFQWTILHRRKWMPYNYSRLRDKWVRRIGDQSRLGTEREKPVAFKGQICLAVNHREGYFYRNVDAMPMPCLVERYLFLFSLFHPTNKLTPRLRNLVRASFRPERSDIDCLFDRSRQR